MPSALSRLPGASHRGQRHLSKMQMRPGHWAPEGSAPALGPSPGDQPPASPSSQAANPSGSTPSSPRAPSAPGVLTLGLPAPWPLSPPDLVQASSLKAPFEYRFPSASAAPRPHPVNPPLSSPRALLLPALAQLQRHRFGRAPLSLYPARLQGSPGGSQRLLLLLVRAPASCTGPGTG